VYNFEASKYNEFLRTGQYNDARFASGTDYSEAEKIRHNGFIAQEVERTAQETGYQFDGVIAPKNDKEAYGLSYSQFVVPLVKAMHWQKR
ncbi:MAG: hypothetical protein J7578_19075, partial [Chitinophagaceae bacterium]|nr:hypothetical protein [Chitinophagaceae bacterium]